MNLKTISSVVLTLLPVVTDTVKAVEEQSAGVSGNGQAKQQLALALIKAVYDASSPVVPFEQIVEEVTLVINALVAFYNTIRAFTTTAKAA